MAQIYRTKPRRVLIFSIVYLPFVGGAEVALKEITDRISRDHIQFDMITLRCDADLPAYEKVGNVHVHRIGFAKRGATIRDTFRMPLSWNKYMYPFLAYFKARALHQEHYYDALWSMQANYAGFAALFTKWALRHVPFILTLQEGDPIGHYKRRVNVLYPLYKKIFTAADMVQAISKYLANFARNMGYQGPLEIVPNGVDVALFSRKPLQADIDELLVRLKKKKDERYIINASRLVEKNGVDDTIKALQHLSPKVKLLIAGDGPDGATLWKLAERLGVSKQVLFLGAYTHEELVRYLAVSDVFVRPSRSEGFGIVFMEAMAAHVPVIATPVGGIIDFLFDPVRTPDEGERHIGKVTPTGLFCTVGDPKDIARQVKRILKYETLRERVVKNAFAMVKEKYDWKSVARSMEEKVFQPVLDRRN